ncbi:hypothetical protein HOLleu_13270 [Holothuria leucospilota]|uniref:Uncharacterized protein n=1 Tax=Holothuria leucospilota TaxID=206669 RepID=A0A9Q1CBL4_HOLLE|nr:hypothetical protein HOLleu_13270 [Holothuria leucospilota]
MSFEVLCVFCDDKFVNDNLSEDYRVTVGDMNGITAHLKLSSILEGSTVENDTMGHIPVIC